MEGWQGLVSTLVAIFMFFILPLILASVIVVRDARWHAEQSCAGGTCRPPVRRERRL